MMLSGVALAINKDCGKTPVTVPIRPIHSQATVAQTRSTGSVLPTISVLREALTRPTAALATTRCVADPTTTN
jgi:hypothetical protein